MDERNKGQLVWCKGRGTGEEGGGLRGGRGGGGVEVGGSVDVRRATAMNPHGKIMLFFFWGGGGGAQHAGTIVHKHAPSECRTVLHYLQRFYPMLTSFSAHTNSFETSVADGE